MNKNLVKINTAIVKWALNEAQIDNDVFVQSNSTWERLYNDGFASISTLRKFANIVKIPFAFLFLDNIPSDNKFSIQFRTIRNKMNNHLSKNLKDTLLDIEFKKDWLSEYRMNNGYKQISIRGIVRDKSDKDHIIQLVRNLLELTPKWYEHFNSPEKVYTFLKRKIEDYGPVVLSNGIVGSNTRRPLNIDEFRGFLLPDDYAPFIFINGADFTTAKCFTLLHEFIHILLGNGPDILDDDENSAEEILINNCVAEIIVPYEEILLFIENKNIDKHLIEHASKSFRVSYQSMALRLLKLELISQFLYEEICADIQRAIRNRKITEGGNFLLTSQSRLGIAFSSTVIEAVQSTQITYMEGCKLFGMGIGAFDNYSRFMLAMH